MHFLFITTGSIISPSSSYIIIYRFLFNLFTFFFIFAFLLIILGRFLSANLWTLSRTSQPKTPEGRFSVWLRAGLSYTSTQSREQRGQDGACAPAAFTQNSDMRHIHAGLCILVCCENISSLSKKNCTSHNLDKNVSAVKQSRKESLCFVLASFHLLDHSCSLSLFFYSLICWTSSRLFWCAYKQ